MKLFLLVRTKVDLQTCSCQWSSNLFFSCLRFFFAVVDLALTHTHTQICSHLYLNGSNVRIRAISLFSLGFLSVDVWLFSSFLLTTVSSLSLRPDVYDGMIESILSLSLLRSTWQRLGLSQSLNPWSTIRSVRSKLASSFVWLSLSSSIVGMMINPRQRPTLLQATRAATAFTTGLALPGGYT